MSAVCVCVRGLGRSLTHNLGQTHAPARTFLTRTARTSRSTSPGLTRSFFGHWTLFVGRCRLSQRRSTPKHITHVTFEIRFEVKLKRQITCNLSGFLRFTRNKTFSKTYNLQCIHRYGHSFQILVQICFGAKKSIKCLKSLKLFAHGSTFRIFY